MQSRNSIMATFFIGTVGIMLVLSGIIFIGYCFFYEIRNNKKLYKEGKVIAVIAIIIGTIMSILSMMNWNKILI